MIKFSSALNSSQTQELKTSFGGKGGVNWWKVGSALGAIEVKIGPENALEKIFH